MIYFLNQLKCLYVKKYKSDKNAQNDFICDNKSKPFLFKTKIIINAVPVEKIKTQDGWPILVESFSTDGQSLSDLYFKSSERCNRFSDASTRLKNLHHEYFRKDHIFRSHSKVTNIEAIKKKNYYPHFSVAQISEQS